MEPLERLHVCYIPVLSGVWKHQDHVQGIDWSLWILKKKKTEADKPNVND